MSERILKSKGIVKKYGKQEVLHNIDLTLEPGKIYGLIGRNGAGKTTLLSILSAQNPATSGEIYLGEEPVWENRVARGRPIHLPEPACLLESFLGSVVDDAIDRLFHPIL